MVPLRSQPEPESYYEDDEEDSGSIPAQLILETALDESTPPESFSINTLLGSIEQQLTEHKPEIQPLPSWNLNTIEPKRRARRKSGRDTGKYIREPDFLPEEFPTGETAAHFQEPQEETYEEFAEAVYGEPVEADYEPVEQVPDETVAAAFQGFDVTEYSEEAEEEYEATFEESYQEIAPEVYEAPPEVAPEPEPEADVESLALFEELGKSIAETPLPYEEPEDLVASLKDTDPLPELTDQDPHTQETVLGQAALGAQEDNVEEYEDEAFEEEAPAWDPSILFEETANDVEEYGDAAFEEEAPAWDPSMLLEETADDVEEYEDEAFEEEAPAWDPSTLFEEQTEEEAAPDFADDWVLALDEEPADDTQVMAAESDEAYVEDEALEPAFAQIEGLDQDDPYIAQIALSLTQMSLELTAEATLLTNEDEIVAIAGELEPNEVEEIRDEIADDWDADSNGSRVRFVTLESSGKDYMLYSRRTVGDFTLSMIFAGDTALRDIRRQGKRLLDALEAVPGSGG